jgi:hypothetical protein
MLTYSVVLFPDNVHPRMAAHTRALVEHLRWELFDHPPYSRNVTLSSYHLFTCLMNWLGSQHFNNNEELMEGVKTWLSSQAADFFHTGIQNLFPDITSASIPVVITFRSSLSMYVFFVYNTFFFSLLAF